MKFVRKTLWALFVLLTLSYQPTQAMEEKEHFSRSPTVIKKYILELAACEIGKDQKNAGKLALVCKNWNKILKNDSERKIKKAWGSEYWCGFDDIKAEEDKEGFKRFYNGKLIYKPDPNSDEGLIEWRICDLKNPMEGTFDLSKCADMGEYLSISTGYRIEKKPENIDKVEIWFSPRFLVEKELQGNAQHLKAIFPHKWPTSSFIGLLWTWGGGDNMGDYDYLSKQSIDQLGNNNLFQKWEQHADEYQSSLKPRPPFPRKMKNAQEWFYVCFEK